MAPNTYNTSAIDLVGWTAGPETRGTLALVWSCLITIFTCTWTVLHLNVPGRDEGPFTTTLRKIKWMAINILFPEFILAKAICDLRLALEELREFDENLRQSYREGDKREFGKRTMFLGSFSHEWSWEVEYPLGAHRMYRLLHLRPPRQPYHQKQLPLRVARLLRSKADLSHDKSDTEAGIGPQSNGSGLSDREPHAPTPKEIKSFEQGLTVNSSIAHERTDNSHSEEGPLRFRWRTVQKWTVIHSYYAQMGGILYQYLEPDEDGPAVAEPRYYCCTASMLTPQYEFYGSRQHHILHHVVLGEEDIKDKSKADWVLKGIAVSQVLWLILSVLVRSIMDLPISQLEIATVSSAVVAILSYMANWWKPKDVSRPTILQTPAIGSDAVSDGFPYCVQSILPRLRSPTKPAHIDDMLYRVPNDFVWMEGNNPVLFILMAISSLLFGGLHCLAWNFDFPSQAESLCWRVASVISASLPAITLLLSPILRVLLINYLQLWMPALTLLRKLEPLNRLQADVWVYMADPAWRRWGPEARDFLIRTPKGSRDWEREPSKATIEKRKDTEPSKISYANFGKFIGALASFTKEWEIVRKSLTHTAPIHFRIWFECGSRMKELSETEGLLEFWQEYENYIKRKHGIDNPNIPDFTFIAFILRSYDETLQEFPQWKRNEAIYDKTSFIFTIFSCIVYTIARLVILVLLFTCLRETPAGVYQVTPWVNFLPNFS